MFGGGGGRGGRGADVVGGVENGDVVNGAEIEGVLRGVDGDRGEENDGRRGIDGVDVGVWGAEGVLDGERRLCEMEVFDEELSVDGGTFECAEVSFEFFGEDADKVSARSHVDLGFEGMGGERCPVEGERGGDVFEGESGRDGDKGSRRGGTGVEGSGFSGFGGRREGGKGESDEAGNGVIADAEGIEILTEDGAAGEEPGVHETVFLGGKIGGIESTGGKRGERGMRSPGSGDIVEVDVSERRMENPAVEGAVEIVDADDVFGGRSGSERIEEGTIGVGIGIAEVESVVSERSGAFESGRGSSDDDGSGGKIDGTELRTEGGAGDGEIIVDGGAEIETEIGILGSGVEGLKVGGTHVLAVERSEEVSAGERAGRASGTGGSDLKGEGIGAGKSQAVGDGDGVGTWRSGGWNLKSEAGEEDGRRRRERTVGGSGTTLTATAGNTLAGGIAAKGGAAGRTVGGERARASEAAAGEYALVGSVAVFL